MQEGQSENKKPGVQRPGLFLLTVDKMILRKYHIINPNKKMR